MTRREVLSSLAALASGSSANLRIVRPTPFHGALRNPLMGFRPSVGRAATHRWATLGKQYIKWNEIENSAADGVDTIREFCRIHWKGLSEAGVKVVPRVYLEWPRQGKYWPVDLTEGDYSSSRFKDRLVRLVEKLGQAWDGDPRVAFIEMGLIGYWGEHHTPRLTAELQALLGDAFTAAFKIKRVMNRYPQDFEKYRFGIYWDSFGHKEEIPSHVPLLESPRLIDRWRTAPMGGETAFDWGTPLGKNPTDAVRNNHKAIAALIRRLHWNHLGWLSDYDDKDPAAAENAAIIQEAFGYRFVIDEARFPSAVSPGSRFTVSMTIRNIGSTPLYYNWPLEASLVDPVSREPVWKGVFPGLDLRNWLPGDGLTHTATAVFDCPRSIPRGRHALALAILDPGGGLPAVKFATINYFRGGRHPIGIVAGGVRPDSSNLPPFDEREADRSLHYTA